MFWSFFQHKPGGVHPNYQSEFSWAEHVSLHFLLCSLEMPDRVLSPCALTHSLEEAGGALIASWFSSCFTSLIYPICLWACLYARYLRYLRICSYLRYEIQLYHSSAVAENTPDGQIKSDSGMLPLVALNALHPVREAHLPSSIGADRHFVA